MTMNNTPETQKDEFTIATPAGMLRAVKSPDPDNPGIFIIQTGADGKEHGACLIEFDPAKSHMDLKVWSYQTPDSDPIHEIRMSDNIDK